MDEGVREYLVIEIDTPLPAARVIRALDYIKRWRGVPMQLRIDNGPELVSANLTAWCHQH